MSDIVEFPRAPMIGELFGRVRDAVNSTGATAADRIAVLELVKAELMAQVLEDMQRG